MAKREKSSIDQKLDKLELQKKQLELRRDIQKSKDELKKLRNKS